MTLPVSSCALQKTTVTPITREPKTIHTMPKHIIKTDDHEILSLEGLDYRIAFSTIPVGATHIPSFRAEKDEDFFIKVGDEYRTFKPGKSVFGFSYKQEDGTYSEPLTAVFCHIGGIEGACVVLGKYSQSSADDMFDGLSPYDDIPSGRWNFCCKYPQIFFSVHKNYEPVPENMLYLRPHMIRVRLSPGSDRKLYGYGPDPETGEIKLFPAQATYIWEPGQVIQQTFIGLDGQPLEKESGVAQRRFSQKKLNL